MSPRASCAKSVIPNTTVPDSVAPHPLVLGRVPDVLGIHRVLLVGRLGNCNRDAQGLRRRSGKIGPARAHRVGQPARDAHGRGHRRPGRRWRRSASAPVRGSPLTTTAAVGVGEPGVDDDPGRAHLDRLGTGVAQLLHGVEEERRVDDALGVGDGDRQPRTDDRASCPVRTCRASSCRWPPPPPRRSTRPRGRAAARRAAPTPPRGGPGAHRGRRGSGRGPRCARCARARPRRAARCARVTSRPEHQEQQPDEQVRPARLEGQLAEQGAGRGGSAVDGGAVSSARGRVAHAVTPGTGSGGWRRRWRRCAWRAPRRRPSTSGPRPRAGRRGRRGTRR